MNRIQTACFILLASAFILSAVLIVRLDESAPDNTAHAEGQNVVMPPMQLMTAVTRNGEESLFILDNNKRVIVVYTPNVGRKAIDPKAVIKLDDIFGEED